MARGWLRLVGLASLTLGLSVLVLACSGEVPAQVETAAPDVVTETVAFSVEGMT